MSFSVKIQPSGHNFAVEAGETILDAAMRHNIGLPYGCRNGRCGNCAATLLDGRITYPSGKTDALEGAPADACLACQAVPATDLVLGVREVETIAEIEVRTLPCRVEAIDRLAHDVVRLRLKLPENQRLQFLAGQYLDFILPSGHRRAFSIANAPHDDKFIELHIRHVPGGEFTEQVFSSMHEKAILRIQAPLGSFVLREQSPRPLMFVAGGTGFAPIKGMIEHAFYTGIRRPMWLYWGVRSRRDLYLADLPAEWMRQHANFRFVPVLSEPDADWQGRRGFVHQALVDDHPDMSAFDLYMAGPPVMVEAAREACEAAGLSAEHMYSDAFEYAAAKDG
ncbi:MAG: CDP-6-deoxy-delta-3,4-glucoseen reductase [Pseudomonadota bacterium]